ncbi:MAG TPA: ATP synthase F0 subunit B [Anaerolineae bacterium]|nr:ATP synthase F0 subunit B [Anaerolineae bacterium]
MDILHLVDRMEELFNHGRPIPFTRSVIVDEDRMLDLIDQMRVAIPEEVKKAQQILVQKDRILAQAQEEANRTVQIAREKSEQLVERDSIVQAAKVRAEQIEAQILEDIDQTRKDADQYVIETLTQLEKELERILIQARNGIKALEQQNDLNSEPDPTEDINTEFDEIEHI